MLRTRLIVGTILAVVTAGMLLFDRQFAPWFPLLFLVVAFLGLLGGYELVLLMPAARRPALPVVLGGIVVVLCSNWSRQILGGEFPGGLAAAVNGLAGVILLSFLAEMATFQAPGRSVDRLASAVWIVAYLGLLPSFLVNLQLGRSDGLGAIALSLAIFVPKGCDIGAYFTGRAIGRHRMTPILSPKKTWEGAGGGLVTAVLVAFGLNRLGPVIPGGDLGTILFGLTVGLAGMLGDLAESLIKRDCQHKDASNLVPGFGGVLDIVDAIVFAAPVAYWWLR